MEIFCFPKRSYSDFGKDQIQDLYKHNQWVIMIIYNSMTSVSLSICPFAQVCIEDADKEIGCADLTVNILQNSWPPVLSNVPSTVSFAEETTGVVFQVISENDALIYTLKQERGKLWKLMACF